MPTPIYSITTSGVVTSPGASMNLSVVIPGGIPPTTLLVVCIESFVPGAANSVTWNGTGITSIIGGSVGTAGVNAYTAEIWAKFSPASGTHNINVTWVTAPTYACITAYLCNAMDSSGTNIHGSNTGTVINTLSDTVTQLASKTELVISCAIFSGNGTGTDVFTETSGKFINDTSSVGGSGGIQVGTAHFATVVAGTTTITSTWSTSDASTGSMVIAQAGWVIMANIPQHRVGQQPPEPYFEMPGSTVGQLYVKPPTGIIRDTKLYQEEVYAFPTQATLPQVPAQTLIFKPVVAVGNSVYQNGSLDMDFYMPPVATLAPTPTSPVLPGTYKDTRFLYKYSRWGHR